MVACDHLTSSSICTLRVKNQAITLSGCLRILYSSSTNDDDDDEIKPKYFNIKKFYSKITFFIYYILNYIFTIKNTLEKHDAVFIIYSYSQNYSVKFFNKIRTLATKFKKND